MWLKKESFATINLDEISRITEITENNKISLKFEYKRESAAWSKYHFKTKEEREEYLEGLHRLINAQKVEIDIIGKLG